MDTGTKQPAAHLNIFLSVSINICRPWPSSIKFLLCHKSTFGHFRHVFQTFSHKSGKCSKAVGSSGRSWRRGSIGRYDKRRFHSAALPGSANAGASRLKVRIHGGDGKGHTWTKQSHTGRPCKRQQKKPTQGGAENRILRLRTSPLLLSN